MGRYRKKISNNYRQNHGIAGVVYILENDGFRDGWYKIGCSRHSGAVRAASLNADANTGTPGSFRCVFEHSSLDCGEAEQLVFRKLASSRRGKHGQEFFEIDLEIAKSTIRAACNEIDAVSHNNRYAPYKTPQPSASMQPVSVDVPQSVTSRAQLEPTTSRWSIWRSPIIWVTAGFGLIMWNAVSTQNSKKDGRPATSISKNSQSDPYPVPAPSSIVQTIPPPTAQAAVSTEIAKTKRIGVATQAAHQAVLPNAPPANLSTTTEAAQALPEASLPTAVVSITRAERSSIEAVCSREKYLIGPAAYRQCITKHQNDLATTTRADTSGLSRSDRSSIEAVCSTDKYQHGPVAYNQCLSRHLESMAGQPRVTLGDLSISERSSIEAACSQDKYQRGPAAYNRCLSAFVKELEGQERADLSGLSRTERSSAEAVCARSKYQEGPAAYNRCLTKQVAALDGTSSVDISGLSRGERASLEAVCATDKYQNGPASYRNCLARQVMQLSNSPK